MIDHVSQPRPLTQSEFRELALIRFLAWKSLPVLGMLPWPSAACASYSLFTLWRIIMEESVIPPQLAAIPLWGHFLFFIACIMALCLALFAQMQWEPWIGSATITDASERVRYIRGRNRTRVVTHVLTAEYTHQGKTFKTEAQIRPKSWWNYLLLIVFRAEGGAETREELHQDFAALKGKRLLVIFDPENPENGLCRGDVGSKFSLASLF